MKNPPPVLERLGFTEGDGLCYSIEDATNNYERLYMSDALKLDPDAAVYFRRFYKKNTPISDDSDSVAYSQPAVYIFNKKEGFFDSEEHKKLHASLWSAGQAEVYIILTDTRIDILNARQPAKRIETDRGSDVTLDDKVLKLAEGVIGKFNNQNFSAHLFGSGTFWEQSEFDGNVNDKRSPYNLLLNYTKSVRNKLSNLDLGASTIDRLLVISILVKFLEEIKDDKGRHTLKNLYKNYNINSFSDALVQGLTVRVLDKLANEFNGKIFDAFTPEEKEKINQSNLKLISAFLRGDVDVHTGQMFIWEQYDFRHLPAEVISTIYEYFIQVEALREKGKTEKGVVYTPIHLVNLLIDEVMPLDKSELFKNNTFRVLDPACGSGVFLVAAYKRMLQWWTINHYKKTKSKTEEIKYPNRKIAQQILEENIFGVDTASTAVLVSVFGLTIALLDKLSPKEIWDNLKLKNLKEKNIRENDFFKWAQINQVEKSKFDLVIGNPPFNPPNGVTKKNMISEDDLALFDVKSSQIPNNAPAIKFLEGALYFGKKVCMIIPSNVILYNKSNTSQAYRNKIFTNHTVEKIFDFTHLRRMIFRGAAEVPIVALSIDNQPSKQQSIQHIVVKREYFSEKQIRFEIDYYDYHKVPWRWAVDEDKQFVWKTNLLGGGQLFHLIYRLNLLKTLKDFLKEKEEENSEWLYRSGYKIGGKTKKKYADFIDKGHKIISVSESGDYVISEEGEKTNQLESFPKSIMYKPPFVVIDQVLGKNNIPIALIDKYTLKEYLYFNRDFVGIHAPTKDISELKRIYNFIKSKHKDIYKLITLVYSGSCMVLTETEINKRDIDALPFPADEKYVELSKTEKIIQEDILKYYIHLGKAIGEKDDGYPLHKPPKKTDLEKFGKTYCDSLNEIYVEDNKSWQIGEVTHTDTFIRYQFGYGKNNGLKYKYNDKDKILNFKSLLENKESNKGVMYKRIIRYYEYVDGYACVYLIKPNSLRYWLKSIALRDAGDTFIDFKKNVRN